MARSFAEAENLIGLMVAIEGRYWLNINTRKSYVPLYNHRRIPSERVRGIAVTNIVRYLRTDVGNIKMRYNLHIKGEG